MFRKESKLCINSPLVISECLLILIPYSLTILTCFELDSPTEIILAGLKDVTSIILLFKEDKKAGVSQGTVSLSDISRFILLLVVIKVLEIGEGKLKKK